MEFNAGLTAHVFGTEHVHGFLPMQCQPPGHAGPVPRHALGREHTLPADHPSNLLLAALTHSDRLNATAVVKAVVGHLLSLTSQISQTAFSLQHHNVEERLARWLLTALDWLPGHEMTIDLGELAGVLAISAEAMARSCGCHAPARGAVNALRLQPV